MQTRMHATTHEFSRRHALAAPLARAGTRARTQVRAHALSPSRARTVRDAVNGHRLDVRHVLQILLKGSYLCATHRADERWQDRRA
eukprot:1053750-Pleurochrysis_carterae.AAC.2